MKTKEVDARGLACPQPVLLAKQALDECTGGEIVVQVDSENARDNVSRLAASRGCRVSAEPDAGGFRVVINKQAGAQAPSGAREPDCREASATGADEVVYLLDADYIGSNMELGKVLVNGFLNAALSLPHTRCTIVLISNAVRLATKGSYALDVLSKLCTKGYRILICGTCLDFFKIRDDVQIGTISNALEIMQTMTEAEKVVKF